MQVGPAPSTECVSLERKYRFCSRTHKGKNRSDKKRPKSVEKSKKSYLFLQENQENSGPGRVVGGGSESPEIGTFKWCFLLNRDLNAWPKNRKTAPKFQAGTFDQDLGERQVCYRKV